MSAKEKSGKKSDTNSASFSMDETLPSEIDNNDFSQIDMPMIGSSNMGEMSADTKDFEAETIKNRKEATRQNKKKLSQILKASPSEHKKKRGRKKINEHGDNKVKQKEVTKRKKYEVRRGRRFSVTGNWYIASGYLNDIIDLLDTFVQIDSWRFKDFASCWRNKSFSLVYRGRQTFKELLEFSEEITLLTKRFLGPPHSTKRRIGALYTLYGLYYKFPLGRQYFFNLHFELNEYQDLVDLIRPFRSCTDNPDPAFVFLKLELDGAIWHCATPFEPCYDFHNEEREHVEMEYWKQRLAKSSSVSVAISNSQLAQDSDLLDHYCSVKSDLGTDVMPEKALSMLSPSFLNDVSTSLTRLRNDTLKELGMTSELVPNSSSMPSLPAPLEDIHDGENDSDSMLPESVIQLRKSSEKFNQNKSSADFMALKDDEQLKEFMQSPTTEYLESTIDLGYSEEKRKKSKFKLSAVRKIEEDDAHVLYSPLVLESKPLQNKELHQALQPIHLAPKKKYQGRRSRALLKASMSTSKMKYPKKENHLVKSLASPSDQPVKETSTFDGDVELCVKEIPASDEGVTTFGNSCEKSGESLMETEDLNISHHPTVIKGEIDETIINVTIRTEEVSKSIKLKVKLNYEQFREIQTDVARFESFKTKLYPLIKMILIGADKDKNWVIEDIQVDLSSESKFHLPNNIENSEEVWKENPMLDVNKNPANNTVEDFFNSSRVIPFKQKFECLKHSDDEGENSECELSDENDIKSQLKKEALADMDYQLPSEEEQPESSEYEGETEDELDLGYECEDYRRGEKRRRNRRPWVPYEVERGPRDSDNLLNLKNDPKRVSMFPIKVGGVKRYVSIEDKYQDNKEEMVPLQAGAEDLISICEKDKYFTWNDFSSNIEPPFKKKYTYGSPYVFAPNLTKLRAKVKEVIRAEKDNTEEPSSKKTIVENHLMEHESSKINKKSLKENLQPRRSIRKRKSIFSSQKKDFESPDKRINYQVKGEDFLTASLKEEIPSIIEELAEDWIDAEPTEQRSEIEEPHCEEKTFVTSNKCGRQKKAVGRPRKVSRRISKQKCNEIVLDTQVRSEESNKQSSESTPNKDHSLLEDSVPIMDNYQNEVENFDQRAPSTVNVKNEVVSLPYTSNKEVVDSYSGDIGHSVFSTSNYEEHANLANKSNNAPLDLQLAVSNLLQSPSSNPAHGISPINLIPSEFSDNIQQKPLMQPEVITLPDDNISSLSPLVSQSANVNVSELSLICDDEINIYYKIRAEDGNDVCIPISFLQGIDQRNVELVAVPNELTTESLSDEKQIMGHSPQRTFGIIESSNSKPKKMNIAPLEEQNSSCDNYSNSKTSFVSLPEETEVSKSSLSTINDSITLGNKELHGSYSCSNSVRNYQIPSSAKRSEVDCSPFTSLMRDNKLRETTPARDSFTDYSRRSPSTSSTSFLSPAVASRNPSCSFFFSPKMKALKLLSSAKGAARGTPPPSQKPKVKFLFKGLTRSRRK